VLACQFVLVCQCVWHDGMVAGLSAVQCLPASLFLSANVCGMMAGPSFSLSAYSLLLTFILISRLTSFLAFLAFVFTPYFLLLTFFISYRSLPAL
jgi:hypothetical protein